MTNSIASTALDRSAFDQYLKIESLRNQVQGRTWCRTTSQVNQAFYLTTPNKTRFAVDRTEWFRELYVRMVEQVLTL